MGKNKEVEDMEAMSKKEKWSLLRQGALRQTHNKPLAIKVWIGYSRASLSPGLTMFSNQQLLEMTHDATVSFMQVKMAEVWLAERLAQSDVDKFLFEVKNEHVRACIKFPTSDAVIAALGEEMGELCTAVMEEPWENVRAEAAQVASTAMRVALEGDPTLNPTRIQRNQPAFHGLRP